jgi:hypothetical protein
MTDVVRWVSNPIADLIAAYSEMYPDKPCEVTVSPLKRKLGQTFFPDDGGTPEVVLCPTLTYVAMMDILAHELAHVAVGRNGGHGAKWKAAYRAIHDAYERRVSAQGETVVVPTAPRTAPERGPVL